MYIEIPKKLRFAQHALPDPAYERRMLDQFATRMSAASQGRGDDADPDPDFAPTMRTGSGAASANAVIMELKQWSAVDGSSVVGDKVVTWVGGGHRDVLHPSVQAGQYRQLEDSAAPGCG